MAENSHDEAAPAHDSQTRAMVAEPNTIIEQPALSYFVGNK